MYRQMGHRHRVLWQPFPILLALRNIYWITTIGGQLNKRENPDREVISSAPMEILNFLIKVILKSFTFLLRQI